MQKGGIISRILFIVAILAVLAFLGFDIGDYVTIENIQEVWGSIVAFIENILKK